ncbi:DUF4350 domain-containing protein [Chitinophagaceae bacterium MMS25-I14]
MKRSLLITFLLACCCAVFAQQPQLPQQLADAMISAWPDSIPAADGKPVKWSYDQGVFLKGVEGLWYRTGEGRYFKYMQHCMDLFVDKDGNIRTYKAEDANLDNVLCGRVLLTIYNVTGEERYYKAAKQLRDQLKIQPRTNEGGFWHKKRYPQQMWLDGLYMAEPFYAEWAAEFKEDTALTDITEQFVTIEQHTRNAGTGLLYHAWDASRAERWADKAAGHSPNIWARAMGWYGMALVDALEFFPDNHPGKKKLIDILGRYAAAVKKAQDSHNGLWWDVMNYPGKKGNFYEASASCMFVYTIAKGVRLGYLPESFLPVAGKGYNAVVKEFIHADASGKVSLAGTVGVSGLGGTPYRDGSFEYYTGEKTVVNDPKGVGAFILAGNEMVLQPTLSVAKGKKILLDSYFNNEYKKDAAGIMQSHHYKWTEQLNGGFSFLKYICNSYGLQTDMNYNRPSKELLDKTNIYIVVDPDWPKENKNPNYIEPEEVNTIYNWVKQGGVLVMMANDTGNVEFDHYNTLAEKFGIHFNKDSRNRVTGTQFEIGTFYVPDTNPVLKTARKIYLKEICTLKTWKPASSILDDNGDQIMAVAKVGKGAVFAVGDPWFYNEYMDGRKLPADYDNYKAAQDLVRWLAAQAGKKN